MGSVSIPFWKPGKPGFKQKSIRIGNSMVEVCYNGANEAKSFGGEEDSIYGEHGIILQKCFKVEVNKMTVRQEAAMLLNKLPDDTIKVIIDLLKHMNPVIAAEVQQPDISMRFGMGKGIISDSAVFDELDGEIEAMFAGEHS